jgi:nitrate reductase gamma subunit
MMFNPLVFSDVLKSIVIIMFGLGVISLAAGIFLLFRRVGGEEVRAIANETARLAQKGIVEEVTGLVGNASALLDALNQLVRTTTGVGVFLTLFGFILMVSAYYLGLQL